MPIHWNAGFYKPILFKIVSEYVLKGNQQYYENHKKLNILLICSMCFDNVLHIICVTFIYKKYSCPKIMCKFFSLLLHKYILHIWAEWQTSFINTFVHIYYLLQVPFQYHNSISNFTDRKNNHLSVSTLIHQLFVFVCMYLKLTSISTAVAKKNN